MVDCWQLADLAAAAVKVMLCCRAKGMQAHMSEALDLAWVSPHGGSRLLWGCWKACLGHRAA